LKKKRQLPDRGKEGVLIQSKPYTYETHEGRKGDRKTPCYGRRPLKGVVPSALPRTTVGEAWLDIKSDTSGSSARANLEVLLRFILKRC